MATKTGATIEDLYAIAEKAEIVNGEIVRMSPTGDMPARAAFKIAMSLTQMERKLGGRAYPDNVGYKVDLPNRKSFSPDASFYIGQPTGMKFLDGAPVFALTYPMVVPPQGDRCGVVGGLEWIRSTLLPAINGAVVSAARSDDLILRPLESSPHVKGGCALEKRRLDFARADFCLRPHGARVLVDPPRLRYQLVAAESLSHALPGILHRITDKTKNLRRFL